MGTSNVERVMLALAIPQRYILGGTNCVYTFITLFLCNKPYVLVSFAFGEWDVPVFSGEILSMWVLLL